MASLIVLFINAMATNKSNMLNPSKIKLILFTFLFITCTSDFW